MIKEEIQQFQVELVDNNLIGRVLKPWLMRKPLQLLHPIRITASIYKTMRTPESWTNLMRTCLMRWTKWMKTLKIPETHVIQGIPKIQFLRTPKIPRIPTTIRTIWTTCLCEFQELVQALNRLLTNLLLTIIMSDLELSLHKTRRISKVVTNSSTETPGKQAVVLEELLTLVDITTVTCHIRCTRILSRSMARALQVHLEVLEQCVVLTKCSNTRNPKGNSIWTKMLTSPSTRAPVQEELLGKQGLVTRLLSAAEIEEAIDNRTSSLVAVRMVAKTTPGDQTELTIVDKGHKVEQAVCLLMLGQREAVEEIITWITAIPRTTILRPKVTPKWWHLNKEEEPLVSSTEAANKSTTNRWWTWQQARPPKDKQLPLWLQRRQLHLCLSRSNQATPFRIIKRNSRGHLSAWARNV